MGVKRLMRKWRAWRENPDQRRKIVQGLVFDYAKARDEKRIPEWKETGIIDALVFWGFIRNFLTEQSWETRKNFLESFVKDCDNGQLIRVVAQVESMPDSLWRKILCKYNIDFMSSESFLRRLSGKEKAAISRNYELLMSGQIPSVFGWWDRHIKKVTVEKLLAEPINAAVRYQSKGAMSYNLMKLDFGFNAYPKGLADDSKVVEISPLRFLSTKLHVDDFFVQQECGGKYWWFYRTARSNYVWKPNREVKLRDHICPGFWYTFLAIHIPFWIISPLGFLAACAWMAGGFEWYKIIPLILFSFTFLWLLAAAGKFSFLRMKDGVNYLREKEAGRKVEAWGRDHRIPEIAGGIRSFLYVFVFVYALKFIFVILLPQLIEATGLDFAFFGFFVGAEILLILSLSKKSDQFLIASGISGLIAAAKLFFRLQAEIIWAFHWFFAHIPIWLAWLRNSFVAILASIADFAAEFWYFLGPMALALIFPIAIISLAIWVIYDEKRFSGEKAEKFFGWLEKTAEYFFAAVLIFCVGLFFWAASRSLVLFWWAAGILFLVGLLSFGMVYSINPRRKRFKKTARRLRGCYSAFDIFGVSYRKLMANPYFSFEEEDIAKFGILMKVVSTFFPYSNQSFGRRVLVDEFAAKLSPEIASRLENCFKRIREKSWGLYMNYNFSFIFLKHFFKGCEFDESWRLAEDYCRRKEESRAKWNRRKKKIIGFLNPVFSPAVGFGKMIVRFVSAAIDIWRAFIRFANMTFNEVCPYVAKPRDLFWEEKEIFSPAEKEPEASPEVS